MTLGVTGRRGNLIFKSHDVFNEDENFSEKILQLPTAEGEGKDVCRKQRTPGSVPSLHGSSINPKRRKSRLVSVQPRAASGFSFPKGHGRVLHAHAIRRGRRRKA